MEWQLMLETIFNQKIYSYASKIFMQFITGFYFLSFCLYRIHRLETKSGIPQDPGHSNGSKLLTYDWEIYGLETVNVGDQAVVYEAWPKEESSVSPSFWVVNGGHITLIREGKWKIEVDWDYPGIGSVSVYSSDSSLLVSMPVTVNGSIMP
ncbi:hypothetical protein [Niabella hibiscisoli]|uniref:hypothetical protein n=1 Tax=Niabella hibiscisoli TaxID=1825928 RepID=UPI001F0DFBF2|nr:hypothetical protein [Niabella hibiscisoli]MCH5719358.1 hypothetical protein [Niabella hibiscisoli]